MKKKGLNILLRGLKQGDVFIVIPLMFVIAFILDVVLFASGSAKAFMTFAWLSSFVGTIYYRGDSES